ncbi:hypothetical protein ACN28S_36720 [Cystobacter fuscus]
MQLRLQLPKRQFLVTEELTLQVTLVNEGPTAVELPDPFHSNNWQPVYHLTGPTQAEQATFTFRSAVSPDKRLVPEGAAPALTRLEAGGRLESEVPLHDWARLSKPGTYQLTASLDWQGLSARSEPIDFTLAPLSVGTAALGLEETASSTGQVWVHWIHREGETGHLYETMFVESRPDLGEVEPHSVSDVGAVGPPTVQPLSAWTNTDRMELLGVWRAWSDGATVFALPSQTPARQQLRLDAPPALIVRPALMPSTGELDMFVIPPGKNEVTLARFRPSEDAAPSGSRVGHVSLPAPIQSARAALGSPKRAMSATLCSRPRRKVRACPCTACTRSAAARSAPPSPPCPFPAPGPSRTPSPGCGSTRRARSAPRCSSAPTRRDATSPSRKSTSSTTARPSAPPS